MKDKVVIQYDEEYMDMISEEKKAELFMNFAFLIYFVLGIILLLQVQS
jgi:hypothetical protein